MVNTVVIFVMLIVTIGALLIAYATALGRLESRVILILIPAATVLLSALTLIARAENPLLLVVVGTLYGGHGWNLDGFCDIFHVPSCKRK